VIASAETERLLDLQKIIALHVRGSRGPLGTLLERYVTQILAIEPPPVSASATATRAWRTHARSHTAALIEAIRSSDDEDRDRVAAGLAALSDQDRVWGAGAAVLTPATATRLGEAAFGGPPGELVPGGELQLAEHR
jgi:hypothetical protein